MKENKTNKAMILLVTIFAVGILSLPFTARAQSGDPYEPNETPEQAWGPLVSGQVYEAYIWTEDDNNDYYYFVPTVSHTASVTMTNVPTDCDFDLYIYYFENDRRRLVTYSATAGNVDESVSFTASAGVKYYVRVYQYRGYSNTQPYHLVAEYAKHTGNVAIYLPVVLSSYPPQPTGNLVVAQGNPTVFHPSVTLTLSATVPGGDVVTQMRFSDDKVQWSEWEPFTTTKSYTLSGNTSELKTVYAQFRGGKGGVSDTVSDQVYLSINGSFEDARFSGWQTTENPLPVEQQGSIQEHSGGTTSPASGKHVVLLGDTDYSCDDVPLGYAAIEQNFHVPSVPSKLTFKYIIWSQDASIKGAYDRFEVYVNGELKFYDGNMVNDLSCSQWRRVPSGDNPRDEQTTGWATGEVDLSAYAGQNVTISFRNYSRYDNWYNTYTYLDHVTIEGNW